MPMKDIVNNQNVQITMSQPVITCEVENEFHYLVKCKQYDQLRNVLFSRLSCPEFDQLNDQNWLIRAMPELKRFFCSDVVP